MLKILNKNKYKRGVTLIELMVVMAILSIISATSIIGYNSSKSSASIQNLADDIALSVRKAQSYAIGVHRLDGTFNAGYGVHFFPNDDISNPAKGSKKSFVIFADVNNDNLYNQSSSACGAPTISNECLEILTIPSTDKILSLTAYYNGSNNPNAGVDVTFKRPNPEPIFCYLNISNGNGVCSGTITRIEIIVGSENNPAVQKKVQISNTGQISVY